MMDCLMRELTLSKRINNDIARWNANQDEPVSGETILTHIDIMHSLIHKAKEGITGPDITGTGENFEQGIRALKAITAMQSYITWDK